MEKVFMTDNKVTIEIKNPARGTILVMTMPLNKENY